MLRCVADDEAHAGPGQHVQAHVAAGLGRSSVCSAKTAPTSRTNEQGDIIAVLVAGHHDAEQMFTQLEQLRAHTDDHSHPRAKTPAEQAVIELVRHSVAEEEHLYPAVRPTPRRR